MGDDPLIREWTESVFRRGAGKEQFGGGLIYSLRGPRGVGKTTLLKLEAKRLLAAVPRQNVMYYSFALGGTAADIAGVVCEYFERAGKTAKGRRFVLLDDVTSVSGWERAIRHLIKLDRLKDCTVIAAGSHLLDMGHRAGLLLDHSGPRGDRNPGDRNPPDKELLPMSFGEFVRARDEEIAGRLSDLGLADEGGRARLAREAASGVVGASLAGMSEHKDALDGHLDAYLKTGGMPAAVDEFQRTMRIGRAAYGSYLGGVESDLAQWGRSVRDVSLLVPRILRSAGRGVSPGRLRRGTGVAGRDAADECIDALEATFAIRVMYRYDPATDGPAFDRPMRLHFQDPFFFHAYSSAHSHADPFDASVKLLADPEKKAALVGQVAADHAVRLAFALARHKVGFWSMYSAFHWEGEGGAARGVDLVVRDSKSLVPIDVQYHDRVSRSDLHGLSAFRKATGAKGGVLVTRDELGERSGFAMVPASLFLLLC